MGQSQYLTEQRIDALKEAADKWVRNLNIQWDIAACWHLPEAASWNVPTVELPDAVDEAEMKVGKKLRRYFNRLDKRIFKSKYNRGFRVKRFITLEYSPGVGWHVHGILATPAHISQQDLIDEIMLTWEWCVANKTMGMPLERLAWCEPITGNYQRYITKQSFVRNSKKAGTIDVMNTSFI